MSGKINRGIVIWLMSGIVLIFSMVLIGGITRLTGSGLSITEWKVVTGTFPPMNEQAWQKEFDQYKQSPQFQLINSDFELENFKSIYWWEYIHRLIGRLIGIVFIIPFIFFYLKKQIDKSLIKKLWFVFFLGGLQGFIGWYMVKSGLVDNPHVSHYRLATHLITAFITCGVLFWITLDLLYPIKEEYDFHLKKIFKWTSIVFAFALIQILYGAFVAGLKAGHVYNTWPKMGEEWIASSVGTALSSDGFKSFFENHASVQFIHRTLAVIVTLGIIALSIFANNLDKARLGTLFDSSRKKAISFLLIMVIVQFILGVITLVYNVPIAMGVLHQLGAFLLFLGFVFALHRFYSAKKEPGSQ